MPPASPYLNPSRVHFISMQKRFSHALGEEFLSQTHTHTQKSQGVRAKSAELVLVELQQSTMESRVYICFFKITKINNTKGTLSDQYRTAHLSPQINHTVILLAVLKTGEQEAFLKDTYGLIEQLLN